MQPPDRFELTEAEKKSLLWQRLRTYIEAEIDRCRVRNDDFSLSDNETRHIRAMIAIYKSLLKLDL